MHRAARLSLILVLLALPAVVAAGNANNLAPCRTYTDVADCLRFCASDDFYNTCACFWDDPTNPNGFPRIWASAAATARIARRRRPAAGTAVLGLRRRGRLRHWRRRERRRRHVEDNCHWFPDGGAPCGCSPPLVDVLQCLDPSKQERFAPFDCQCPYLTREEWLAQGARGACAPPALDHFMLYKAKTSKGAAKFVRFGSVC